MRSGNFVAVAASFIAIFTAMACQQRAATLGDNTSADEQPVTEKSSSTSKKTSKTSCLGKADLAFDDATCNSCISNNAACCDVTVTCFGGDDANCAKIQKCVEECDGEADGTDTTTPPAADDTTDPPATPPAAAVSPTFQALYDKVKPTCGACHASGGSGPTFFGADAASTLTTFKAKGYDKSGSKFETKGAHTGPALSADAKTALAAWVTAAGAAGVRGTVTGKTTSKVSGAASKATCKQQCRDNTKWQDGLDNWEKFNACTTSTCKDECL